MKSYHKRYLTNFLMFVEFGSFLRALLISKNSEMNLNSMEPTEATKDVKRATTMTQNVDVQSSLVMSSPVQGVVPQQGNVNLLDLQYLCPPMFDDLWIIFFQFIFTVHFFENRRYPSVLIQCFRLRCRTLPHVVYKHLPAI